MHSRYLFAPFGNCNIVVGFIGNAHLGNQFSGTSLIQRAPCETCYSAPNICSSKPWSQLSLPGRVNDEQWNLFSPEL
jgi:hypothetical protein